MTHARLGLASMLAALLFGCGRAPTIERVPDTMPPRFRIHGDAKTFGVVVTTPTQGTQGSQRYDVLWHVRPDREGLTPDGVGTITYGAVPAGMRAIRFEGGSTQPQTQTDAPPSLVFQRVYIASITTSAPNLVSTTDRNARVCFEILPPMTHATVRDAPCPAAR